MPCARLRSTLALGVLLILATFPALPVRADTTATDPTNTVSIQVPDSWQLATAEASAAASATASATARDWHVNFLFAYRTTSPDGTFSVSESAGLLSTLGIPPDPKTVLIFTQLLYPGFQLQNASTVTLAGDTGAEIDFTATRGAGIVMAEQQLWVGHNNTIYLLGFEARPGDSDAMRAAWASILTSWQWLG